MTEQEQKVRASLLFDKVEEALNCLYPERDTDPMMADVIWDARNEFIKIFESLEEKKAQYATAARDEALRRQELKETLDEMLSFMNVIH